jgi:hypothetical protein
MFTTFKACITQKPKPETYPECRIVTTQLSGDCRHYSDWTAFFFYFRPMLSTHTVRVLLRATSTSIRDFRLYGLIRRTGTHVPQWDWNLRRKDHYAAALSTAPRGLLFPITDIFVWFRFCDPFIPIVSKGNKMMIRFNSRLSKDYLPYPGQKFFLRVSTGSGELKCNFGGSSTCKMEKRQLKERKVHCVGCFIYYAISADKQIVLIVYSNQNNPHDLVARKPDV